MEWEEVAIRIPKELMGKLQKEAAARGLALHLFIAIILEEFVHG